MSDALAATIFQLFLIHSEIVAEFMDDGQADLFVDFRVAGANRLNILLVEDVSSGPLGNSNTLFFVVGTP